MCEIKNSDLYVSTDTFCAPTRHKVSILCLGLQELWVDSKWVVLNCVGEMVSDRMCIYERESSKNQETLGMSLVKMS